MSTLTKTEITDEGFLTEIKHPWQPDWIYNKEDVGIFLELMDAYRHLVEDAKDWYPPFIVFIEERDGKQMLSVQKTYWFLEYDPFRAGKKNPLEILRENGVKV